MTLLGLLALLNHQYHARIRLALESFRPVLAEAPEQRVAFDLPDPLGRLPNAQDRDFLLVERLRVFARVER